MVKLLQLEMQIIFNQVEIRSYDKKTHDFLTDLAYTGKKAINLIFVVVFIACYISCKKLCLMFSH